MKCAFDRSIPADTELKRSIPPSDLDHVVASANFKFEPFKKRRGHTAAVDVRGWMTQPDAAASDALFARFCEHSLRHLEIAE